MSLRQHSREHVRRGELWCAVAGVVGAAGFGTVLAQEGAAASTPLLVNGGVKGMFRRHRPVWEEDRPRPHRIRLPKTSSFPSGHASAAFTAAGVLSQGDPLWPVYYGLAVIVSSSRVYVKMHHASDVIAGAAIGVGFAALARRVWPKP